MCTALEVLAWPTLLRCFTGPQRGGKDLTFLMHPVQYFPRLSPTPADQFVTDLPCWGPDQPCCLMLPFSSSTISPALYHDFSIEQYSNQEGSSAVSWSLDSRLVHFECSQYPTNHRRVDSWFVLFTKSEVIQIYQSCISCVLVSPYV